MNITFLIKPSETNTKGKVIIYCRFKTDSGNKKEISSGIRIFPDEWDSISKQIRPISKTTRIELSNIKSLNETLTVIETKLRDIHNRMVDMGKNPTAKMVKDEYEGRNKGKRLSDVFDIVFKKKPSSWKRINNLKNCIFEFTKEYYKVADMDLQDLANMKSFNNDIEYYVINVKKWGTIYTKSQLSYFRICLDEAVKMDWIEKNPISHNIKIDKTESKVQEPLTKEEFENLKNTDLSQNESLQRIRDIFVFQCYSGLAYVDVKNLKYSDIQKDGDTFFIIKGRQKTATKFIIPLITGAMGIIDRYRNDSHRKTHYKDFVFPVKSNAKTNSYLKVIADLAGIPKNLTTHIARYTCNQLLYEAGVSDELRKQILGHSAITMTAHYTKSRVNILRDAINKIGD